MEDLTGKQLGPYRVVAPLGEGGMAAVYKAYHANMDRYVAVKILPQLFAKDPQFVGRFKQEAQVLAKLQHPHILPVFDFGESEGYTYIAMPFVETGTLTDLLQGKPLPLAQICNLISQVGDALDYAHTRGLVHRDVKPSNVLVDERGNCLLTDFGIAKIVEATSKFTGTGGIVGTPAYMSPEQGRGDKVDSRSDIYALGVVLFELATGRVPFDAETPIAIVFKHIQDPLPMPSLLNPALPDAVERVILKALAKSPADRFATASEMVRALKAAIPDVAPSTPAPTVLPLVTPTVQAAPLPQPKKAGLPRWALEAGGLGVVACVALLAVVIGGGTILSGITNSPITPTTAPNTVATKTAADLAATQTAIAIAPTAAPRPTSTPVTVLGTIKVVSDLPMTGSSLGQMQTIVNAITMAFEERQYTVCNGLWSIDYESYDDASAAQGKWDPEVVVANANAYISDPSIVAVIGTFNSGAAKLMIPILNPENLVMISPANTYPGLTKPGQWNEGEPDMYYPNGIRNYTRVVPADDVQGAAGAQWAKDLGVNSVYLLHDGELYGSGIARVFAGKAEELGIELVGYDTVSESNLTDHAAIIADKNPDLVYFGGITQNNAGQLFRDIRAAGYIGKFMGPGGIYEQAFLDAAGFAAEGVYVTFGGMPPAQYTGAAADWRDAYSKKFVGSPEVYAVYSYVSATLLMDAFDRVCASGVSLLDRAAVRAAVFATENFNSVLGPFSLDKNGDTTLILMSGSQVRNGQFQFVTFLGRK